ncbi:hypothetical protein [Desulfovibrio sp. SGI.169]|uniref:hypothetical protein n=1 Tax=Desulfovibrio sp. SGI.169 TaxID=3420561 RepID=UPI003D07DBD8
MRIRKSRPAQQLSFSFLASPQRESTPFLVNPPTMPAPASGSLKNRRGLDGNIPKEAPVRAGGGGIDENILNNAYGILIAAGNARVELQNIYGGCGRSMPCHQKRIRQACKTDVK